MRLCVHSLNLDLQLMNVHMKEGSGISFALPPFRLPLQLNSAAMS